MARKRDISPELWENKQLSRVRREARLLFVGCISHADDDGRLQDSAAYLKSKVFAFDEGLQTRAVAEWLGELIEQGLVCRYTVDGESYLHLPSWKRWQTINRAYPSRLPVCPRHAGILPEPSPPTHPPFSESSLNGQGALTPRAQAVTGTGTGAGTGAGTPPAVESAGATTPLPRHPPVDAEYVEALVLEYAPRMSGPLNVRDAIEMALNHKALHKAIDQRLYVRQWLNRDVKRAEERAGIVPLRRTNGHPGRISEADRAELMQGVG